MRYIIIIIIIIIVIIIIIIIIIIICRRHFQCFFLNENGFDHSNMFPGAQLVLSQHLFR